MIEISNTVPVSEEQFRLVIDGVYRLNKNVSNGETAIQAIAANNPTADCMRMLTVMFELKASKGIWRAFEMFEPADFLCTSHKLAIHNTKPNKVVVMTNYSALYSLYNFGKNVIGGLDRRYFREWVRSLPHSELITGENYEEDTDGDTDV